MGKIRIGISFFFVVSVMASAPPLAAKGPVVQLGIVRGGAERTMSYTL